MVSAREVEQQYRNCIALHNYSIDQNQSINAHKLALDVKDDTRKSIIRPMMQIHQYQQLQYIPAETLNPPSPRSGHLYVVIC